MSFGDRMPIGSKKSQAITGTAITGWWSYRHAGCDRYGSHRPNQGHAQRFPPRRQLGGGILPLPRGAERLRRGEQDASSSKLVKGGLQALVRCVFCGAAAETRALNPNGIPSSSPGLRGTSYPGSSPAQPLQPHRGCGPSFSFLVPDVCHNAVGVDPVLSSFTQGRRADSPTPGFET
jgi:hypothetical protein